MFSPFLKAEDTTKIVALDKIDLTWWGKQSKKINFPNDGKTYRKIIMNYTLSCPGVGCNRFDYTTKVEAILDEGGANEKVFELGRVMTPYGSNLNASWSFNHEFDITDYAPILKDSVSINAWFQGYPDDGKWWVLTVDFLFIEGTPPRTPIAVDVLYNSGPNGFLYGNPNNSIENQLDEKTFQLNPNTKHVGMMMSASGHGFGNNTSNGNPDNCAEFCAKNYTVKVNGSGRYIKSVWRDDCGLNPMFPQNGTWIYNRAGWCPGSSTDRNYHDITPDLPANEIKVDVDWEPYTYTGGSGFPIHYIIEAAVFQYGAINFELDAAIEDILVPSKKDVHIRKNPACKRPQIILKNLGSEALQSVDIVYGIKGAPNTFTQKWTGGLRFNESTIVELQANGYLFANAPSNVFEVRLEMPNGKTDNHLANNSMKSSFDAVPHFPNSFFLWGNTNNAAHETSYDLKDDMGNVLYSRNNFSNGESVRDTFELLDGCYTFTVYDSDCDGMNFSPYNSDGNGSFRLHRADGTLQLLQNIQANFACEIKVEFTVGSGYSGANPTPTGLQAIEMPGKISIYPNPASSSIFIQLDQVDFIETLNIYNLQGQMLLHKEKIYNQAFELDISALPRGILLIEAMDNHGKKWFEKVVKL